MSDCQSSHALAPSLQSKLRYKTQDELLGVADLEVRGMAGCRPRKRRRWSVAVR